MALYKAERCFVAQDPSFIPLGTEGWPWGGLATFGMLRVPRLGAMGQHPSLLLPNPWGCQDTLWL